MTNNQIFNKLLHLTGCGRYDSLVIHVFALGGNNGVTSSMIKGWKTADDERGTYMPDKLLDQFIQGLFKFRDTSDANLFYTQGYHAAINEKQQSKPKVARRHNKTGIKGLSIGHTKNSSGQAIARYTVNFKTDGKARSKTFYFGERTSQLSAFNNAVNFMVETGLIDELIDPSKIFKEFKHSMLA